MQQRKTSSGQSSLTLWGKLVPLIQAPYSTTYKKKSCLTKWRDTKIRSLQCTQLGTTPCSRRYPKPCSCSCTQWFQLGCTFLGLVALLHHSAMYRGEKKNHLPWPFFVVIRLQGFIKSVDICNTGYLGKDIWWFGWLCYPTTFTSALLKGHYNIGEPHTNTHQYRTPNIKLYNLTPHDGKLCPVFKADVFPQTTSSVSLAFLIICTSLLSASLWMHIIWRGLRFLWLQEMPLDT